MGIDPTTLSPQQRQLAGVRIVQGHAAPPLGHALRGYVRLKLIGEPPTTTHHDKTIGMRGGRRTLVDSPALLRARRWYEQRIAPRRGIQIPPLLSPVVMSVGFFFPYPPPALHALGGDRGEIYCQETPDLDNALKVLTDVLAMRGYVENDSRIAKLRDVEKRYSEHPRVVVYLRSLTNSLDNGQTLPVHDGYVDGELWPLAFQAIEDAQTVANDTKKHPAGGGRRR